MSPGGMQPVIKSVATSADYLENDTLKAFAAVSPDISNAFSALKFFGSVDGKNFVNMGDITAKSIVSGCIYDVVVQGAAVDARMSQTQSDIEAIVG
jgi:multiple sugar transport system substrate-binding protein